MDYQAIITNVGATKIAAAVTEGTQVSFLNFAVGDGSGSEYVPSPTQTALKHEVWRGGIATLTPLTADPTILEITTAIPANVGGFSIREYGIFDSAGDMIAIGNTPTISKSGIVDTYSNDLAIKVLLKVNAEEAVTLDAESIAVASRADMVNLEGRVNTTMNATVTTVNQTMQSTVDDVEADLAAHTTEIQQIVDDAVEEVKDLGGYSKTETDALLDEKITAPRNEGRVGQVLGVDRGGLEWLDLETPPKLATIYKFSISPSWESDPTMKVTYPYAHMKDGDNVDYTPAAMNYSDGYFDLGSWRNDDFFMPRPCMVDKYGNVEYYLDPTDYTKKEDGTESDVGKSTSAAKELNAMMEWGRNGRQIWYKIVPYRDQYNEDSEWNGKSADVFIADRQVDEDYQAPSFINENGDLVDHFYTGIYPANTYNRYGDNTALKSQSGKYPFSTGPTSVEYLIDFAEKNNRGYVTTDNHIWGIVTYADRLLINLLTILITKSLNAQEKIGAGYVYNGGSTPSFNRQTGAMNQDGMFFGKPYISTGSNDYGVKLFGMEDWWGGLSEIIAGSVFHDGKRKIKLTYGTQDGTTVTGYNDTGDGYIDTGITSIADGYISDMLYTENGMFPIGSTGSSSTHFCDYITYRVSGTATYSEKIGGYYGVGEKAGPFYSAIDSYSGYTRLAMRPLKE